MDPARDPRSDAGAPVAGDGDPARRRSPERSAFANVRTWWRAPRKLRPTRAGWCFFLLIFGVGFAALNTGNNLLYLVLALMLAFLVLSGVLSEAALRGIRVRRRVPREVFAERDARVQLEIHNDQQRAAAFAVVVEDRVAVTNGDRPAGRCFALRIAPGGREVRSYGLRAERRGELDFLGFVVFTRFPFGLFSKSLLIEDAERVLVYPAVDTLATPALPEGRTPRGDTQPALASGASPLASGLRGWVPGDPRRRILWPASQRAGHLLVRSLESESDEEVRVRLRTDAEPGDRFEGCVRRAASEVVSWLDAGRRVGLDAGGEAFDAAAGDRHRATLLGFLARVEPGTDRSGEPA
ncbi:MAG: DUF58 domain-containing protein [Myxococcota bacterium]